MSHNMESRYESHDEQPRLMTSDEGADNQNGDPAMNPTRNLRRSKQDRVIAGVCGGLGHHLDVDPVLFRIAFLLSLLAGGAGLVAYIVFWIAVPEVSSSEEEVAFRHDRPAGRGHAGLIAGGTLVILGVLILAREFLPWFDTRVLGAFVLIGIGVIVLMRGVQRG